ncbi:uncharacterized protein LOC142331333 [Lycorma delicatula]|uniref:uncharacterized protein LOC142331333 n=1 Tax=Lycorma delicatula TaxID=130591 RepID=UPI003F514779
MFLLRHQVVLVLVSVVTWFNCAVKSAELQYVYTPHYQTRSSNAHQPQHLVHLDTYDHTAAAAAANYLFNYGVHDFHTGDFKSQWEQRAGDSVKGQYSLLDSDGTLRTVDYTADDHSGFNAIVKKSLPRHSIAKPIITTKDVLIKKPILTTHNHHASLYHPLIKTVYSQISQSLTKAPLYNNNPNLVLPFTLQQRPQLQGGEDEQEQHTNSIHNPGPVLFPKNTDDTTATPDPSQTSGVTPPPQQFIPPKSVESLINQIIRSPETQPRDPSQSDLQFPTIAYLKRRK